MPLARLDRTRAAYVPPPHSTHLVDQIEVLLALAETLPKSRVARFFDWCQEQPAYLPLKEHEYTALRRFAGEPLFRLAFYDACKARGLWPDHQTKDCPTVEALGRLVNRLRIPARMKGGILP